MDRLLNCQNYRRFGVEIELNTSDGIIRKLDRNKGETPLGSDNVALLIRRVVKQPVEIQSWGYNYNNNHWIIKSDRSCGMEVCTPVLKGYNGLLQLIKVIEAFRNADLPADKRCSLHVHVDVSDLNSKQLASVIAWYIKCEHVFMDSVPPNRKLNRYCQMLSMTDDFHTEFNMNPYEIFRVVSKMKYYSLNAYHFFKGGGFDSYNTRKRTIEFRIGENEMCLDGFAAKNWIRLLLHFIEMTKNRKLPLPYQKGNHWTGLAWLEPSDVFSVLGFDQNCTEGLDQVKRWFVERIIINGYNNNMTGFWSNESRFYARQNFLKFIDGIDLSKNDLESRDAILYDKNYSM